MNRGRFITLEGGEGAGKSTHARFITEHLKAKGRTVVQTREPGGSPTAEAIRQIILSPEGQPLSDSAELLLMFAARAAHLSQTVWPALGAGQDVVCDRFVDSSYAYQGAGRGFPEKHIRALEEMVLPDFEPDLTFVFDLDPSIGLERTRQRGEQNRFESESLAYLQRVREKFVRRAQVQPQRYVVLDAARDLISIQRDIVTQIEKRWP